MKTVVLLVAFDGTKYSGMQNQRSAPSVQQELEKAFYLSCGYHSSVIAAGRTDAGVHARGMVAHVRVRDDFAIPEEAIKRAFNSRLPRDIRVRGSQLRDDELFHARFDAIAREYSYTIRRTDDPLQRLYAWQCKYDFNVELLDESAKVFLGVHNFTTFSKLNEDVSSYICNVQLCEWERMADGSVRFHVRSNRFVYGMVRSLVGAMMDVARSKRSVHDLSEALAACDRRLTSPLAPAHGLIFEQASYPQELHVSFT